mgnify:CR=1 FL=1
MFLSSIYQRADEAVQKFLIEGYDVSNLLSFVKNELTFVFF